MKLSQLISNLEKEGVEYLYGESEKEITSLVYDSRKVEKGSVFVCISGSVRDAHDFIPEVIEKGASVIVIEKDIENINGLQALIDEGKADGVTFIKVPDSRKALAVLSASYFGNPAEKLITIGITGTKGKTTTTYMIKDILERSGISCGLIGTIEIIIGDEHIHAANTTPESYQVQEYFSRMVAKGIKAVVMEVSSQGLMLHRVSGFTFNYGIFTNLEPDHIGENEHKDFEDYMHCKSLLFKQCKVGIVNIDSEHVEGILKGHTCEIETYSAEKAADFTATDIKFTQREGKLETAYKIVGKKNLTVDLYMPGMFSVYNSLTAIALCSHFDISDEVMKNALLETKVKGRCELVDVCNRIPGAPKFSMMIDYAHNAMALESLLVTLKAYNPGRIVTIFGCGGNRAKSRRYEMGEVSSRLSDLTIVTSDNPRFEEPQDIINDILTGISKADGEYVTIIDRAEAVKYAIENAKEGDVIVLAGKGHEDYQEIKGVKYHMDENELIDAAVEELK